MNTAVFHHLRPAIVSRSQFRIFNGAPLMQRTNYALNIYRSIAMSVYIKCEDSYDTVKLIALKMRWTASSSPLLLASRLAAVYDSRYGTGCSLAVRTHEARYTMNCNHKLRTWLYDRYYQCFTVRIIRRNEGLIAEVTFLDMMSGISMVDELHQTVREGYIHVSYCMISNYLSMHAMVTATVQHIFWTVEQPTSVMRTV